jgi:hypothetical protein
VLSAASVLYASKYGYRALLSKVLPIAAIEEKKGETALPSREEVVAPPAQEMGAAKPELQGAVDSNVGGSRKSKGLPPPAPSRQEETAYKATGFTAMPPPETRTAPADQPVASKRGPMPTVLVVTSGEQNASDIIESILSRKLQDGSFPLSASKEIQALAERYGRHGIPLNALDQQRLKADILVYVSVNTVDAAPLKFYGRTMEQHASTISIKVIDTATQKVIHYPHTKTVNYTTLNMQENIEEATEEMISDLSQKLGAFWKG